MTINDDARARARAPARQTDERAIFAPYKPAPGVVPAGAGMAMDSAYPGAAGYEMMSAIGGWEEGQQFLGYPVLSILAQRADLFSAAIAALFDRDLEPVARAQG